MAVEARESLFVALHPFVDFSGFSFEVLLGHLAWHDFPCLVLGCDELEVFLKVVLLHGCVLETDRLYHFARFASS